MPKLATLLLRLFAWLPLPFLHGLGNVLGSASYWFSPKMRRRVRDNIRRGKIDEDYQNIKALVKSVCRETMKSALELPIAWFRSPAHIAALFRQRHGWAHIEAALAAKQGLLLITPHIGSYDLAGRYISHHLPFALTAMYRPPKQAWLEPIMNAGRERDKGRTAPANAQGVRLVLKALKQGEATIVLPDQVPSGGDGIWVDFFGHTAYTMSLAARLAQLDNVTTLFFVGERLSWGRGFALHVFPLQGTLSGDKAKDTRLINHNVEALIRRFPEQYLFSYNRYKTPAGAEHDRPNEPT